MDPENSDQDTRNDDPDWVVDHFKRIDDNRLFALYEEANTTILYGTSGQGKSYMMRQFIARFLRQPNTTVLILKNTIEKEADKALYNYSIRNPSRLHFAQFVDLLADSDNDESKLVREQRIVGEFLAKIRLIIDAKRDNAIEYFHDKIRQPNDEKFIVVFDDILGFEPSVVTDINRTLKELSVQGRHSDFRTYILLQHYKSVRKITRSNVNVFSVLTPIDPEYTKQVFDEYFRTGTYREFVKFTRQLPRYSKLAIKKSTGEFFVVSPSRTD